MQFSDAYYTGSAVKIGAGVEGYEITAAAAAEGLVVVGGECPTVGLAGGYVCGRSHFPSSASPSFLFCGYHGNHGHKMLPRPGGLAKTKANLLRRHKVEAIQL